LRSPFTPKDETTPDDKDDKKDDKKDDDKVTVKIDLDGVRKRLLEVPIPAGNYSSLAVNDKSLFWLSSPTGDKKTSLQGADIATEDVDVKTLADDVKSFELSQ